MEKRILVLLLFSLCLLIFIQGCKSNNQEFQENKQQVDSEQLIEAITQKPSETPAPEQPSIQQKVPTDFKASVELEPEAEYRTTNEKGHYSTGPLNNIQHINWISPYEFTLRLYDDQHTSIHYGVINEKELRLQPVLKAATGLVYINDILPDARGTVLIGFGDNPGLFWYRDGKLQQYQKVQFYSISPQQKNMILFYDSKRRQPFLIDLITLAEQKLPTEVDHGWPVYTYGLSFSPDEKQLLYENWEQGALAIYDLEFKKEAYSLNEKGHNLLEGSLSPQKRQIAYLKWDKKEPTIEMGGDGRSSLGQKLAIYDLEKQEVIKEWTGEPLFISRPIWSPNGQYLLGNMVKSIKGALLEGEPYIINLNTAELSKISNENNGINQTGLAWSADGNKILVSRYEGNQVSHWVVDIHNGVETEVDESKHYILQEKKLGTVIFDLVNLDSTILKQYKEKENLLVSPGGKYVLFIIQEDGKQHLKVVPLK